MLKVFVPLSALTFYFLAITISAGNASCEKDPIIERDTVTQEVCSPYYNRFMDGNIYRGSIA